MKTTDKLWIRAGAIIFGIVAFLHFLRLVTGIPVRIGDWILPHWMNFAGFLVACVLGIILWRVVRNK